MPCLARGEPKGRWRRLVDARSGVRRRRPAARPKIDPPLVIHGRRDSTGTWAEEKYGVEPARWWLGHSGPTLSAPTRLPARPPAGGDPRLLRVYAGRHVRDSRIPAGTGTES